LIGDFVGVTLTDRLRLREAVRSSETQKPTKRALTVKRKVPSL